MMHLRVCRQMQGNAELFNYHIGMVIEMLIQTWNPYECSPDKFVRFNLYPATLGWSVGQYFCQQATQRSFKMKLRTRKKLSRIPISGNFMTIIPCLIIMHKKVISWIMVTITFQIHQITIYGKTSLSKSFSSCSKPSILAKTFQITCS